MPSRTVPSELQRQRTWRTIFNRSTTSSTSPSQGSTDRRGHSSSSNPSQPPGNHAGGAYYPTYYPPLGPYPSCPYHPPYGGYAGWWHLSANAGWSAHDDRNGSYPDSDPPFQAHPYSHNVSQYHQTPYLYQPLRNSSARSLGANRVPDESQSATRGHYLSSRNNSSTSMIPHSSAHNTQPYQPSTSSGGQTFQSQSTPRGYNHPYSRSDSSTSFHHHNIHDEGYLTPYESSTYQRFPTVGQDTHSVGWGPPRHVYEIHAPSYSSSSLHQPSIHHHTNTAHSQESFVPQTPSESPPLFDYQLASLLSARAMYYPSINWIIWDKVYSATMWQARGTPDFLDKEMEVFVGRKKVREPIYIKSPPGRTDGFSLAIYTWGPIRVVPRSDTTIRMIDIMKAMYHWLVTPLEEKHWTSRIFEEHVTQAFNLRKNNANSQARVTGDAKRYAQVVDTLFCRVRWNGLTLSEDFSESKIVYLNLLDVRSELGMVRQSVH